jgi:hypothetical protein
LLKRSAFVLLIAVATACGGSSAGDESAPSGEPAASPSAEEISPLVGEWRRVTTCQELVGALEQAGLGDVAPQAVAGNGFVRGTPEQLGKKDNICEGAVPREHSHFFTEWGTFGSLDWNGEQVDDGVYEIVDEGTFTIGDATFRFEIEDDTIQFEPVLPDDCSDSFDCAWMVSVAYAGHSWERVV